MITVWSRGVAQSRRRGPETVVELRFFYDLPRFDALDPDT